MTLGNWNATASTTSGVFIWCPLWSGYQLGREVINYPTLSIILGTICQESQLWKTALTMCWTPLTPPSPLHLPFVVHSLVDFPESSLSDAGKCRVSCPELGIPHNMHELVCKMQMRNLNHCSAIFPTRRRLFHIFTWPRPNRAAGKRGINNIWIKKPNIVH